MLLRPFNSNFHKKALLLCYLGMLFFYVFESYSFAKEAIAQASFNMPLVELKVLTTEWAQQNGYNFQLLTADNFSDKIIFANDSQQAPFSIELNPDSAVATFVLFRSSHLSENELHNFLASLTAYIEEDNVSSKAKNEENHCDDGFQEEAINHIKPFIPLVACMLIKQHDRVIQVSAIYLVKSHMFLTTAHDINFQDNMLHITLNDSEEFAGYIVAVDKEADLALIKPDVNRENAILSPIFRTHEVGKGEEIFFIGCPLKQGIIVRKGIIDGLRNMAGQLLLQVHMQVDPGCSGGSVLDEEGRMIGVLKGRLKNNHMEGFIIPAQTVIEFISKSQIKKTEHSEHSQHRFKLPVFKEP